MRVGVLGSGLIGGKLGTLLARAGHDVVFSYSRSEQKLKRLARDAGAHARAGTPADAARDADALVLAVHWSQVNRVLKQTGSVRGKVLITCSLPMNTDNTALVVAHTSSGAEVLAKRARGATIVSAFSTVPSEALKRVFADRRRPNRPSLIYCGNDKRAKAVAARLIRDLGFDPIDAGPLRLARYLEPFSLLLAHLAYETNAREEVVYRISQARQKRRARKR
jgi:predicted dinucleotide-binding enzyme